MNPHEKQLELERKSIDLGIDRYRNELKKSGEAEMPPGRALSVKVLDQMTAEVEDFLNKSYSGTQSAGVAPIKKFIRRLGPTMVAFIAAREIISTLDREETIQNVAQRIADRLDTEMKYQAIRDEDPENFKHLQKRICRVTRYDLKKYILEKAISESDISLASWPVNQRLGLGVRLIAMFCDSTGMAHLPRMAEGRNNTPQVVRGTEKALTFIEGRHAECELMHPAYNPMVVEPLPWKSLDDGGYLTLTLPLVKTDDKEHFAELKKRNLSKVLQAVNAIQETPWRINRQVYEIMSKAWSDKGGGAQYMLPNKPEGNRFESRAQSLTTKLSIAEKFLDEDRIYFPHNLDFRGRVYAIPASLNPQGDDKAKALLEFAEGKPLRRDGLKWLLNHAANSFGYDKATLQEKLKWVEENKNKIIESARDPLEGSLWWTKADKPYQFLASCLELRGYWNEGVTFQSRLPVSLDGACNGLQHFSALMKDQRTAEEVNLGQNEDFNDFYGAVAELVSDKVMEDSRSGLKGAQRWKGKVDRKIVKRGVMTFFYGATPWGLKDRLAEALKEMERPENGGKRIIDDKHKNKACGYLRDAIIASIEGKAQGAAIGMRFLRTVAAVLADHDISIRWESPNGLLIWKRYLKYKTKRLRIAQGSFLLRNSYRITKEPHKIRKSKQINSTAANFIHSLDAAHLQSSVVKCKDAGISAFHMIHDSFGTHAGDMETMEGLLKETFREKYSVNVMECFLQDVINDLRRKGGCKLLDETKWRPKEVGNGEDVNFKWDIFDDASSDLRNGKIKDSIKKIQRKLIADLTFSDWPQLYTTLEKGARPFR